MSWFDCNHQLIAKHQCWSIYCILYLHIYYTYISSFWWFHKLADGWENLSMEISSIANLQLSGSIHESFQAEVWVEWTSQIIMLTRGLLFRYCRWIDLLPSENCDGFIFPPPEKTGPNLPSSKLGFCDSKWIRRFLEPQKSEFFFSLSNGTKLCTHHFGHFLSTFLFKRNAPPQLAGVFHGISNEFPLATSSEKITPPRSFKSTYLQGARASSHRGIWFYWGWYWVVQWSLFRLQGPKSPPKPLCLLKLRWRSIYTCAILRGFMILVIVYCCLILHMFMVQLVLDQRPKIVCNIESWRKLRSMKFCVARLPHQRQWGEVAPNGNLCWKKGGSD